MARSNSRSLITIPQSPVNPRAEINLIDANARGLRLKGPGRELMPLKADMLGLPDYKAGLVMDAVELLFAASMRYVGSQLAEAASRDAVGVVAARLDRGLAEGTVTALIHSDSIVHLLREACKRAPIAMHAILHVAPELEIRERIQNRQLYFRTVDFIEEIAPA